MSYRNNKYLIDAARLWIVCVAIKYQTGEPENDTVVANCSTTGRLFGPGHIVFLRFLLHARVGSVTTDLAQEIGYRIHQRLCL